MGKLGKDYAATPLRFQAQADSDQADALQVEQGASLIQVARVIHADNRPVAVLKACTR